VPIPGTTKRHRLQENVAAASVELTADESRLPGSALARKRPPRTRLAAFGF